MLLLCSKPYLFLSLFLVRNFYFLSLHLYALHLYLFTPYLCLSFFYICLSCVLVLRICSTRFSKVLVWVVIYIFTADSILCMWIFVSQLQICLFQFYRIDFYNMLLKIELLKKKLFWVATEDKQFIFSSSSKPQRRNLTSLRSNYFDESPFW